MIFFNFFFQLNVLERKDIRTDRKNGQKNRTVDVGTDPGSRFLSPTGILELSVECRGVIHRVCVCVCLCVCVCVCVCHFIAKSHAVVTHTDTFYSFFCFCVLILNSATY